MKGIYLVTDEKACLGRPLESVVEAAAKAGACCVQLREKTAPTRDFLDRALKLKALLEPFHIPLLINDRLDIALAADTHGVHLGQSDMPPEIARRLLGPKAIIGLSVSSLEDVKNARGTGVDYLGVGPIFPTLTKADAKAPLGLDGLEAIRTLTHLPLVAIGGLNLENIQSTVRAGADAIAMVSAICSATDPFAAAKTLAGLFKDSLTNP